MLLMVRGHFYKNIYAMLLWTIFDSSVAQVGRNANDGEKPSSGTVQSAIKQRGQVNSTETLIKGPTPPQSSISNPTRMNTNKIPGLLAARLYTSSHGTLWKIVLPNHHHHSAWQKQPQNYMQSTLGSVLHQQGSNLLGLGNNVGPPYIQRQYKDFLNSSRSVHNKQNSTFN